MRKLLRDTLGLCAAFALFWLFAPQLTYLPNASANAAVQAILTPASTYYLSLHNGSPGQTGANEVTGGSYARQTIAYSSGVAGVMTSTTAQNFTGMPSTTVDHWGDWSAVTAGTYECGGATTSSLTVPSGATVACAIGAMTISVSG